MAVASASPARPRGLPAADDLASRRAAHRRPESPRPTVPRASAGAMRALHGLLAPNRLWRRLAGWLESSRLPYRGFVWAERAVKERLFGCRMCAQCALPTTAYACPMTCPKQLRNGPCGGVSPAGNCEVYPERRCVWVVAYERAAGEGRVADLRRLQRPIDQRRWGQSSWVSYWLGRDGSLWTEDDGLGGEPPPIRVEPSAGGGP